MGDRKVVVQMWKMEKCVDLEDEKMCRYQKQRSACVDIGDEKV